MAGRLRCADGRSEYLRCRVGERKSKVIQILVAESVLNTVLSDTRKLNIRPNNFPGPPIGLATTSN